MSMIPSVLLLVAASFFSVVQLETTVVDHDYKIICYFTNWARYRKQWGYYTVDDINPHLCTHLIYSFVKLEDASGSWDLATTEWHDKDTYKKFNAYKEKNLKLKTLVAVGGYNHGTLKFTKVSSSSASRKTFAENAAKFLRKYDFDGLDLDWEFPGHEAHKSPPEDKQRFTLLAKDLREAFEKEAKESGKPRLLLSAAVSCGKEIIDGGYEIAEINKYLDWIGLMAYDLHGRWNKKTGANAPLYGRSVENGTEATLNVDWAVNYYLQNGADANKLVMGVGTYGQTYKLKDSNNINMDSPTEGTGASKGPYTGTEGFLSYYEICDKLTYGWGRKWDNEQKIPYAYSYYMSEWVGYDDVESIAVKAEYIKKKNLAGTMIWTIDLDDFTGRRCNRGKYPSLQTINDVFVNNQTVASTTPSVLKQKSTVNTTELPDNGLYKRVCYFTNWAKYRPREGKFTVGEVDPELCTHVIFAFANVSANGYIYPTDPEDDMFPIKASIFTSFNKLKEDNPNLKTLLAIGGWSAGTEVFTSMTSSDEYRRNFVETSIGYLRIRGFDGLDMDWEFPAARGSPPEDRERFTLLIKELREAYEEEARRTGKERLLLTAAVHVGADTIEKGYEPAKLSRYVDWFNLMAYDFEARWGKHTGGNAPLFNRTWHWNTDIGHTLSVDWAVRKWISLGTPSRKIMLGIGTYGQTFELKSKVHTTAGAYTTGKGGSKGEYTGTAGFLSYYEICHKLRVLNWTRGYEDEQQFPYAYKDMEWVGYDDVQSVTAKMTYIKYMKLGGAMAWTMDTDDFSGGFCNEGPSPLISLFDKLLKPDSYYITTRPPRNDDRRPKPPNGGASVRAQLPALALSCGLIFTVFKVFMIETN